VAPCLANSIASGRAEAEHSLIFAANLTTKRLAKALLVHAASWGAMREGLTRTIDGGGDLNRRDISQLLGYGAIDAERIVTAATNRVLLLGAGSITADQRQTFALPLLSTVA